PDKLKGDAIPLGARIIAVVDAYDAMTADRPYRGGLGVDEAVKRLKAGIGTQFDPRVCATWIELLIKDGVYTPEELGQQVQVVPQVATCSPSPMTVQAADGDIRRAR
ncbi:MAG: HD-GYP domain-containing protein, partial [Chloroflexota bacterium]